MRHRVALVTMALGSALAGSASAYDATPVIFDLSALQEPSVQRPIADRADRGVPMAGLPLATPSVDSDDSDVTQLFSENGDELLPPKSGTPSVPGTGATPPSDRHDGGNGRGHDGTGRGHD